MGSHPINLAVRFILELAALFVMGLWGWAQHTGWMQFVMALGIPLIAAMIWGLFTVPDDPSRGKNGPIPVSGMTRLLIEALVFGTSTWMLFDLGKSTLAVVLGGGVILHYVFSLDRLQWLMKQKN